MNFAVEDLDNFDVSVYKYGHCLIEMYIQDDIYLNEEKEENTLLYVSIRRRSGS